jgi:hypothetical protein
VLDVQHDLLRLCGQVVYKLSILLLLYPEKAAHVDLNEDYTLSESLEGRLGHSEHISARLEPSVEPLDFRRRSNVNVERVHNWLRGQSLALQTHLGACIA